MESIEKIIAKLENSGVVPVIKLEDISKSSLLASALQDGGIYCAEVTFRAEGADKVIASIAKEFPSMTVGAGTVLTIEQAKKAVDSGAEFLVAPGFNQKLAEYTLLNNIPFVPGVSSASEIEMALQMGFKYVKFFPAEQAGGLAYIKAVSAPYSQLRFMPTGGISENNILDYLAFDKVFACGGSWMVSPQLISTENWSEITRLSKCAVDRILGFSLAHVGINCDTQKTANQVADKFLAAFGFDNKSGTSSIFSSDGIEIMKTKYLGEHGHIAIKTNSVFRAIHYLGLRGFEMDTDNFKYDNKGKIVAAYLKDSFGGFAVHIVQKN